MNRTLLVILVCFCIAGAAFLLRRSDPYASHFKNLIPAGSRLLNYQRCTAGFDVSYAFVFAVADDTLAKQIVREWELTPWADGQNDPTSGAQAGVTARRG
jgi:hypothetical protein